MTEISILLPLRNEQPYLETALVSIAGQAGLADPVEVIAIDDGSTDGTPGVLEQWQSKLPIRIIRFDRPRGIVAALNNGLELAAGRFIGRMDGDDIMEPGRLAAQLAFMRAHPDIHICGCRVRCFNPDAPITNGVRRFENWSNRLLTHEDMVADLYLDCPLVHPSWFVRRELYQRLGGYRDTGGAEDYDFFFRTVYGGYRAAKLPETLLSWRDHENRETRTNRSLTKTRLFAQKARFFRQHEQLAKNPLMVFGVGRFGKALADALLKENLDLRGFVDPYDRYTRSTVRNLPVLSLADPVPPETALINAYPVSGNAPAHVTRYLERRICLNWVL